MNGYLLVSEMKETTYDVTATETKCKKEFAPLVRKKRKRQEHFWCECSACVRANHTTGGAGGERGPGEGVMPTWKGRRDEAVKWPSSRALPPTARHFTPGSARKDDASPQIDGQTAPCGDARVRARPSRSRVSQSCQLASQPASQPAGRRASSEAGSSARHRWSLRQ